MSIALSANFSKKEIMTHPGGHYFPATVKQRETFLAFFMARLEEHLIRREIENAKDAPTISLNIPESSEED